MKHQLTHDENQAFSIIDSEFESLLNRFYNSGMIFNVDKIKKAYETAKYFHRETRRKSGELYLYHPLAVLEKLYNDGFVDPDVLAAAMLHDTVEDTDYTLEDACRDFGSDVSAYIRAVTKIEKSKDPLSGDTKKTAQQQTDEHMLEMGRHYPLALYIKLADRWHNLRTCSKMPAESINYNVWHTKTVLIPLARNIGCNVMADQLLDACMLAQFPEEHSNITKQQSEFLKNSRKGINKTVTTLKNALRDVADVDTQFALPLPFVVKADIRKNFSNANLKRSDLFSIYQYKPYAQIFCKLNSNPTGNLVSSFMNMCKTLISSGTITIINENAETEVKSAKVASIEILDLYYNKIKIILLAKQDFWEYTNPLAKHKNLPYSTAAFLSNDKKITVYSMGGHPIEIEKGSTALDFAFIINNEIGAHYLSAEVNNKTVEIDYVLQPEDVIKINKSETPTARLDWFKILTTKTAINRLVEWLNNN